MWRGLACQTLPKALDISSVTTYNLAPELLEALAILSDTALRRSAVDEEDVNPYWNKKGLISLGDQ